MGSSAGIKSVAMTVGCLYVLWSLTGCSVVMALSGKESPNLQALHVGSTKGEVEAQLGPPVESHRTGWGARTDIYEYETGNDPDINTAAAYFLYDLLTLGFAEPLLTIGEFVRSEKHRLPIYYGPDGRVAGINETAPETPAVASSEPASRPPDGGIPKQEEMLAKAMLSEVDTVPSLSSKQRPNAHAVVTGISRYREKLPPADFADRDGVLMGEYLTKAMGFPEENVVVLLNERAAKVDLEKYVEAWLPNRVEKDDSVFIYYSGHGAPNPKTGDAYLVPYDGDPAFVSSAGYPIKRLYERLNSLPAKDVVVVLDSCFSGAGGRSVIAKGMRPVGISVENPVLASGNTLVLAASAGDQISSTYEQKGQGLLTYFFLKGLQGEADQNKDHAIELTALYSYLKPQVERVARREFNNEQTPQLLGNPEILKRGVRLMELGAP